MSENANDKVVRLSDEQIEKAVGGNNERQGIPCPECGFFIDVSTPALLASETLVCPGCGLILTFQR